MAACGSIVPMVASALLAIEEVSRLLTERRATTADRPIVAQSARNRFRGIVTRVEKDKVAAVVRGDGRPAPPGEPDDGRGGR